ncbi:type II toxin-antitoxin system antitoxin SocA domain-containing protein [Spirulina sp. 06S082]|uniref:type II toxin-antitoxin system antitoxin SocA domain-containing protein n=1 Tax=Spirulina sp. 06S082 TaxID=3110248 RepID=UPI002B216AA4|nr:type II toxin-antitoxin system antitoxin SocA domain-containing protein [Spirulina sp. 06S082]MEA5470414.1 type II toxin-antitoxin system antitoxin SocA domain-containing protein [Spirulina sp. 06S082]
MLEKLIQYFVRAAGGSIEKTRLVKFLYLADLSAVKWMDKQLTDLNWYYGRYGPWDQSIDLVLKCMNEKEIELKKRKNGQIVIRVGSQCQPLENLQFAEGLELMLDNIQHEWSGGGHERFKELKNYIDNTEPILEIKECKPSKNIRLNLQREREKLLEEAIA